MTSTYKKYKDALELILATSPDNHSRSIAALALRPHPDRVVLCCDCGKHINLGWKRCESCNDIFDKARNEKRRERWLRALVMRMNENKTYREIGSELGGVGPAMARYLVHNSVRLLRHPSRKDHPMRPLADRWYDNLMG